MSDIMPSLAAGDVVTIGGRCFTIVGEIGRGSFGIVFSAVEVATGARVALKLRCYTAPMLRDDAQEIDEDEDEHEQELLRTVPFDVVLANATRDEVVAQERAAAAERAAPAVIAWAGNVIVMDLIDSATHATLSFLIWSSFTSAADDFTAEQQLAVVAVLAKLHHAGVPYDNADMFGSVFVPLRPECGGAFLVDHKPRRRRPGSVWRALVAQFCRHGNPLRMVSGVLREHREWFGVDDTTVPPEQWAEFVSLQDAVRADCGVSFARPEGFDDCVYALLTAAAPAAGIAAGGAASAPIAGTSAGAGTVSGIAAGSGTLPSGRPARGLHVDVASACAAMANASVTGAAAGADGLATALPAPFASITVPCDHSGGSPRISPVSDVMSV